MDRIENGLSQSEVSERIEQGLVNHIQTQITKSKKDIIRIHVFTFFNLLNVILAVLVLSTGQIKNLTFLGVVFINTIIGIVQELKVKALVDQLTVLTAAKTTVRRDGKEYEISLDEIVMDDLLLLHSGEQIGADCVLLKGEGVEVNESLLTGESLSVRKEEGDQLLSGSFLVAGSCIAKVIHVGSENYAVNLTEKARHKKRAASEMQDVIKRVIKVVAILIIPIGSMLFLSQRAIEGTTLGDDIVNTVAGIIGMIPEGLVLLTSISFIVGVGRLAKRRALVQEMEAIEALARVDLLCLDKTGTITTGELEVRDLIILSEHTEESILEMMGEVVHAFEDTNATQRALLQHFKKIALWHPVEKIPFSSERKYRAVAFAGHENCVLGAPDRLLTEDHPCLNQCEELANEGYRVLLLGTTNRLDSKKKSIGQVVPEALIVLEDCVREDAAEIFEYFRSQHVELKVISGDHPVTVSKMAMKAGLDHADAYIDAAMLPEHFQELRKAVKEYTVFGRVTPEQKQQIIKAFQANRKTVGMVGDGVNDVLALKDADCGIAMAGGSAAARQAAHIVLLDSDFIRLKDIVKEGRMIISNIERVSALYLTKTIYSMLLSIAFVLIGRTYPFIPIHLTLIGATTIGIPSFILALEHTESVTENGFLQHILRISLPGALALVVNLLIVQGMAWLFAFEPELISTYNLLVGGIIGLLVLSVVCRPMNRMRKSLVYMMLVLFVVAVILLPGLFSVESVFCWRMIFIIPISILSILSFRYLTQIVHFVLERLFAMMD